MTKKNDTSSDKSAVSGLRLIEARALLTRASGATSEEIMTELGISRATLGRYFRALGKCGDKIAVAGERGRRKVRRIVEPQRNHVVAFTLEEIVWQTVLSLVSNAFAGTGIDDTVRAVWTKMHASLRPKERAKILDLERKFLDLPEHVHDYTGKAEIVDQIVTALIEEQPLLVKHESKKTVRRQFRFDPYTLVTFKRALYVIGFSHFHKAPRTLALEGILDATRQSGESFAYPKEWDPKKYFAGAFGIIPGEETEVVLRFDASVEPWIRSRIWSASQTLRKKGRYVYLTMRPRGTTEVLTWVLGWGDKCAVVSPASLRNEWARHAESMAAMARKIADAEKARIDDAVDTDDEST